MRSFWACNHGSAAIAPLSPLGMGEAPSVTTRAGFSATSREPSASALGDLRATVRAFRRVSPHGPFTPPAAAVLCGSPVDSAVPSHGVPSVSFGAPIEDQMSIAASVDGQSSSGDEDSAKLHPSGVAAAAEPDPELTAVLSRPPRDRGWRRAHLLVPSPRGEMIGSSARAVARDHALPRFLSSRKCTRSWWLVDGPFLRPEAARLPPPSSLPSMAGRLRVRWHFPRWRVRLQCTCACKTPPLGGVVLVSRPKPVGYGRSPRPRLAVLRAKPPLRCMPRLSCVHTRPRH